MSTIETAQEQVQIHSMKHANKFKSFFQRYSKTKLLDETLTQILHQELRALQQQLEYKEINFRNAEPEYIDVAIMELEAIRLKYSITVRQLKEVIGDQVENAS